jgi:tetratricopeptide (TPR) repeat protein
MLGRLHQLEQEVEGFRAVLDSGGRPGPVTRRIQHLGALITQYWVLFSVLGALATALYVQYRFDIDYFEDYRNQATTKNISEFYRQLGDRMLANSEWKAAEDAYRAALEVNPNNSAATYGILKSQVFQPLEGEQYYVPEVVDTKLEFLLSAFPEDYQVHFLKGTYYLFQGDDENAREWLQSAIERNPQFIGSYLNLGYIEQRSANLEEAQRQFEKVLALDPDGDNAMAHNNLGFLHLLQLDFDGAVRHLERADALSPHLLTTINLGDANLFMGNFSRALQVHTFALGLLNSPGIENERYVGGQWLYNFMPLEQGDRETIQHAVHVGSLSQKKAVLYYRLSLDQALVGNYAAAEEEFERAQELDPSRQYSIFFAYRINSMLGLLDLQGETKAWLETHRTRLQLGF